MAIVGFQYHSKRSDARLRQQQLVKLSREKPRRGYRGLLHLAACCFLLVILAAQAGYAQTFYASIAGIVTDPQGAVVPDAAVSVVETSTLVEYKTVTNHLGRYSVSFLQPGEYVVRIGKAGFEKYSTLPINLVLNQPATVDAVLRVGVETQSITVSAAGTALNDTNPQIANQFGSSDLVNLPQSISSHGGNPLVLAASVPGISGVSKDNSSPNEFSLGGGRASLNQVIIDGLPSNMGYSFLTGLIPTVDSTAEVQVLTAQFSAQYGQTGGGAILTTSRSGTANFHGSLFEYHTDQSMDALGYFTSPTAKVPVDVSNYFGGSVGGPVWLPKLFNGRNHHLFFFTDWEDTLTAEASTLNTDVPTTAELSGNFSGVTPTGTASPIIYNPATSVVVNGKRQETAFPGNIIPASSLDPVGVRIASYYPAPNCSLNGDNYCVYPTGYHSYLYNTDRIDYNPTDYDHIWAKFSRDGPTTGAVDYIPNAANTSELNGTKDDNWVLSWSHIFSRKITNELRGGYVSEVDFEYPNTTGVSSLGLTGVTLSEFPSVTLTSLESLGTSSVGYEYNIDGHYILNDALVVQLGRHVLSIGGEYMSYYYTQYEPGILSGSYAFTGTFSSVSGQSTMANAIADLELGFPATTTISTNNTWFRSNARYDSLYIQDDYRLTQKLTLNSGLRWEYDGNYAETRNQMYTFNLTEVDPTTQKLGAVEFAGYDGAPHVLVGRYYLGFLPRIGFSYHALKNTVVRGGYGIYELPEEGVAIGALSSKNTVKASFVSPNGGVTPAYQLKNGVPATSPEVGANGEPLIPTSLTDPTQNVVTLLANASLQYNQQWQLGIQQDLGGGWLAEVDYVGNHGVHLPTDLAANQIPPTPGCCYGQSVQSRRPYPQVLGVNNHVNDSAADYNALFAQLTHRWRDGISMLAAYTWAKEMDDVDAPNESDLVTTQNIYNLHAEWGVAMIDVPQRLSITGVYAVPIGAGGKLLATTPVVNQIIGHWRVSTIASFQIGDPANVSQTNTTGLYDGSQFTTQVGKPEISRSSRTITRWFNTNAFAITPPDTLGNTPRASVFGPGQNVWNMNLMRDIPITEHFTFTFLAQANNVFNHPQFDGLDTTITDSTFGKVTAAEDPRELIVSGRIHF